MNNRNKLPFLRQLFVGLLASVALVGCQKDEPSPQQTADLPADIRERRSELDFNFDPDVETCVGEIPIWNGMLHFEDTTEYLATLACLDAAYEQYNDDYETAIGADAYTVEQLDSLDDIYAFDEDQALIAFENSFSGYSSLRKLIYDEVTFWLEDAADGDLNLANDPDDDHYISDFVERTLINAEGLVRIGSSVIWIQESGMIYEVTDADMTTVEELLTGADPEEYDNVIVHDETESAGKTNGTCEKRAKNKTEAIAGDRKFTMKGALRYNWFTGTKYLAKIRSFKKKNGNWKRKRADLSAQAGGTLWAASSSGTCQTPISVSSLPKAAKRKKVKSSGRLNLQSGPARIKQGEMVAAFSANGRTIQIYIK